MIRFVKVLSNGIYIINSDDEMILHMVGWYEGREEDISKFCEYACKNNIILTEPMKNFFKEFGGLKGDWWWWIISGGRRRYLLYFDLTAENAENCSDQIDTITEFAKEKTLSIGDIGSEYPFVYAIGESGKIYLYDFYSYRVFDSLIESMEFSIWADRAEYFGDMLFL